LLRAEVEQLQAELAQHDVQIAEMTEMAALEANSGVADVVEPHEDTTALVERLEQLLDELERKDEQVAALEDLLNATEAASRADQEERRQLEAWVRDIEGRIGQRESEWKAAEEKLLRRIDELAAERDRAEQAMEEALSGGRTTMHMQGMVENLRRQIAEREKLLEESDRSRAELERSAGFDPRAQVEEMLREERLELARQQASVARERVELESARTRLQRHGEYADSEDRIRALRQHLQEIQTVEKQEREERSLSTRLSRLWNRLDKRGNR
jgi:hypothetical protein